MPNSTKTYLPFICHSVPLVICGNRGKLPSIWTNEPIIRKTGFTLVELMVTLAVVTILALIVVPNVRPILQNNRLSTTTNDFLSDINLARSEAIKRARDIEICTWNSTASPTAPACDGSGNWSGGWLIWVDMNRNGALDTDEIVRSREALAGMTLRPAAAVDPITFDRRGVTANAVDFALCDDRGPTKGKSIKISQVGQASSSPNLASCN